MDKLGEGDSIVEFEWTVDGKKVDGLTGQAYNAPPRTLSNGWHGFGVRAKDNEGNWSKPASINILLVEPNDDPSTHKIFLPFNQKP
jgi:hypothetical protein